MKKIVQNILADQHTLLIILGNFHAAIHEILKNQF